MWSSVAQSEVGVSQNAEVERQGTCKARTFLAVVTLLLVGLVTRGTLLGAEENAVRLLRAASDQCDTTGQCKAIYGEAADDCLDSRSSTSVCMCGEVRCDSTTTSEPTTNSPSPQPTTATSTGNPTGSVDQCDTTGHCKAVYGAAADDCLRSLSSTSVCMCGEVRCDSGTTKEPTTSTKEPTTSSPTKEPTTGSPTSQPTTATPTGNPTGSVDQCDTTDQCKATYGPSANDCLNSGSSESLCMCGEVRCDSRSTQEPTISSPTPPVPPPSTIDGCTVSGKLQQWHRVAIECGGFAGSEANDATFTDHRFDVTFKKGGQNIKVPGHFAADGYAADSGASAGSVWRAYFSPPSVGTWSYVVSFRKGTDIVVDPSPTAGSPLGIFNGQGGSFTVRSSTASSLDMRSRGLLSHRSGERYLRFADGTVFVEGGMDSPENIFGYHEFDNTIKFDDVGSCKGILHKFNQHTRDWNGGDPTWKSGKGKSLIGVVNYISSKGVNAIYIMMNTVRGDGCDAHPWSTYNANGMIKSFDVSKLDQWERVLGHMTSKGIMIHAMTQETENDQLLNGGALGFERKLYYRELISRFGHHPALQWNLGEENTNTASQRAQFASFIKAFDPYDHPVAMHNFPNQQSIFNSLLGNTNFDGPTIQYGGIPTSASGGVYGDSVKWMQNSAAAGHDWVVTFTEASGRQAPFPNTAVTETQRVYWMWASVMSGGAGFEWYLKNDGSHAYDLAVENLREFDGLWEQTGYLVRFFKDILQGRFNVNLLDLQRDNSLTSTNSDWVLADRGVAYLVFLRDGGSTLITLTGSTDFRVYWFNPRSGVLTTGSRLSSPSTTSIGMPPTQTSQDWAALIVHV